MPRFQEERVSLQSEQVPEILAKADDSDEDWIHAHKPFIVSKSEHGQVETESDILF